jgi:probable glycosyltransferase
MDVSIIIVNYNTLRLTRDCIESIKEKTHGVDYEIIVVDNGSTDGSRELFENNRDVVYIYSAKNGGFGYGNNIGIKHAKGKYLLFLNSDTLLLNNAIKEFYDYAETHALKAIYGCYLQKDDGSYSGSFHYFPSFTVGDFIKGKFYKKSYAPDYTNKEVECICGADMFVPREAIAEAGMFDENIFLYGEEGELQRRMMKKGYKRMLINTPKIVHLEGQSMGESYKKLTIKMESHFYILCKHATFANYFLLRMFYTLLYTVICLPHLGNQDARTFLKSLYLR